ncbi:MAG TPA: flagellar motor switch protein FliG [Gammaproteobacteria bacterium]|nr:flagellar motor switch protein FliG [Gammaproteobacteria bacterium]
MPTSHLQNGDNELDGASRAAILLMTLGEEKAARIIRLMDPEEVQSVGHAMTSLKDIPQEAIAGVLDGFVKQLGNQSGLSLGKEEFLQKALVKSLGREKANNVLSQVFMNSEETKGLESLRWMDPRAIYHVVQHEHPQIIAIVLTHLPRDKAGAVLDMLPDEIQTDVMVRVANLDTVHPAALKELDQILQQRFEKEPEVVVSKIGGIKVAAEILNTVSSETESRVFEALNEYNDDMSEQIQESMFVFENLLALDDRGMQLLLREVPQDKLVKALKGASLEIREKVFNNVSSTAAELMRDDLEAMGPIRLREVEEVQKEIMAVAQRLAEEGQIALGNKEDEFV